MASRGRLREDGGAGSRRRPTSQRLPPRQAAALEPRTRTQRRRALRARLLARLRELAEAAPATPLRPPPGLQLAWSPEKEKEEGFEGASNTYLPEHRSRSTPEKKKEEESFESDSNTYLPAHGTPSAGQDSSPPEPYGHFNRDGRSYQPWVQLKRCGNPEHAARDVDTQTEARYIGEGGWLDVAYDEYKLTQEDLEEVPLFLEVVERATGKVARALARWQELGVLSFAEEDERQEGESDFEEGDGESNYEDGESDYEDGESELEDEEEEEDEQESDTSSDGTAAGAAAAAARGVAAGRARRPPSAAAGP